jgi:type VI secretion system secreted protein VgrG
MADRDSNNFLHILEAPGAIENYKLFRMDGDERLSSPFDFRLTLRSQGEIPPASAWVNASITFSLGQSDKSERKINGRCTRFEHLYQKGSYVEFAIEIAPAFEALRLTRDRRLWTDRSARQVVEEVLGEHRIAFDDGGYRSSPTRAYIVQHDESDFDLVSRLLEDEGAFYFFRFDEGAAPYKHRMIIAGDTAGYYDGDPFELSFRRDHLLRGLTNVQMGYASAPAAVLTHDYDFTKPGSLTPVTAPSKLDWAARQGHVFRWASGYADPAAGRDRAKLHIEGSESGAVAMHGTGSYAAFAPGARFQVPDERLNPQERRIVVRSVHHEAFDPYSRDEGEPSYQQRFEAQPSTQVFRPERRTPPAVSAGPQTAVVLDQVDPDGHGRIKVRFHWDHTGHSTCWVRVLQQWAGNGMGAQFVPRPGMEVLVAFIDGAADRPVVVGCLYNGANKHSYAVPANLTQAGWRSYGQGGLANEFLFEDKAGGEEIYLHAGRDFRREVMKNEAATIGETQHVQAKNVERKVLESVKEDIGQMLALHAGKDILLTSDTSITLKVGGSQVTINGGGVWIDGTKVNLNSGAPPAPALDTAIPAIGLKGGAAPGTAAAGGGGGAGGGSDTPGASAANHATGNPVTPATTSGGAAPASPASGSPPVATPRTTALARKLVKPGGSGTQADAEVVAAELAKMPEPALKALAEHHVGVIAARGSVTDFAPEFGGQQPRGWPPGSTLDHVPGAFVPSRNAVVIATTGDAITRTIPATGQGHGSANLVFHETVHAIDQHAPASLKSTGADFVAAHAKDLAALPPYETQAGDAGLSESYAESAARYYGGSHGAIATPALDDYWRTHVLGSH